MRSRNLRIYQGSIGPDRNQIPVQIQKCVWAKSPCRIPVMYTPWMMHFERTLAIIWQWIFLLHTGNASRKCLL